MAISTYKTYLMAKLSGTYQKVVDIKDFPDLGGSPEMLETTTMSDAMQTYIPGIQKLDGLDFTANYDKSVYDTIKSNYAGKQVQYAVYFGENGEQGKYYFNGSLSVHVTGAGVNEVVNMVISIAPSTAISTTETALKTSSVGGDESLPMEPSETAGEENGTESSNNENTDATE